MLQNLLEKTDTADGLRLTASGLTIACILAPVTLRTGFCNIISHLGIDHCDKVIQLGSNFVVSLFRKVFLAMALSTK